MGRAVVGDESLEATVDAFASSGVAVSVGLLIGRLGTGNRDLILGLVPTPVKEDGADAAELVASSQPGAARNKSRLGSQATPSLSVDFEWVAEHARQVSRMLLGGIGIAGIYCLVSENIFRNSTSILTQLVKSVLLASCTSTASIEGLMLHVATSPRRFSCKACSLESNGHLTLNASDSWRISKVNPNLQTFTCSYSLDVRIPVTSSNEGDTLKDRIFSWMSSESKAIQAAEALVDNSMDPAGVDSSRQTHEIQLLLPLKTAETTQAGSVMGTLNLNGEVHARAYGIARDSPSNAIIALKEDIVASLRNRIELFCEEKEQDSEQKHSLISSCEQVKQGFTCILPRRVLLPWNGLLVCDYILPSESLKDTEERHRDLFGSELSGTILQPEEFGSQPQAFFEDASSKPKSGFKQSSGAEQSLKLTSSPGALLAVVVAMLVAFAVLFFRK